MKNGVILLAVALSASMCDIALSGECAGTPNCGCHVQCPNCRCYCKLTVDKDKEKKHCFDVECKPICIPKVRFPWEKCCKPKCAYVKHVHVLKKVEYECEHCKYKWEPVCVPCPTCSHAGCSAGCSSHEGGLPPAPDAAPASPSGAPGATGTEPPPAPPTESRLPSLRSAHPNVRSVETEPAASVPTFTARLFNPFAPKSRAQ